MAQASTADSSRERAVSSEPCSTRPNPFDEDEDDKLSARKRRRTSLTSDSRSRSAETLESTPSSPTAGMSAPERRSDSAMKIDPDTIIPTTPERQKPTTEPGTEPRSSRVTINVRTPSQQPLEALPPSPPSPSNRARSVTPPSSVRRSGAVKNSVEDVAADLPANNMLSETLLSSSSGSGSPPIEVISVAGEDDADFDDDESITMLDDSGRSLEYDPTATFPFHDATESYLETVIRLLQYLPTHEQVSRHFVDWIDKYLSFVKAASPAAVEDSYFLYRDMWQAVPHLVLHMDNRKSPYLRSKDLRQSIFAFYRSFSQLTAFFVEFDLRIIRNQSLSDQARIQALASPPYLHALGALTRREEVTMHSSSPQLRNGEEDWSYLTEMSAVVDTFQNFPASQGGSLANIRQLALFELRHVSQFPRVVTEHLGNICLVAGNIMKCVYHRPQYLGQQISDSARRLVSRMYAVFTSLASMLSDMVEKNLNQLSPEGAGNIIEGATEIYQTCLATPGVVPPEVVNDHLQDRPPVAAHLAPEAMAYHWKFSHFVKLIKSSQMQLRVMAVSTMCSDLVALYRKTAEPPGDDAPFGLVQYIADFLLSTGLINYVLGPTCHPEITLESSNIIGFLVVSHTYSRAHTDTFWQTVTSTQDPRVSDALIRMIGRIANLFPLDALMYFLEKLNTVPVENFGSTMREFCDQVLKQILTRFTNSLVTESIPFDLFIRLIRQSSVFGPQSPVAYPDIQQFAIQKLDSILSQAPGQDGRWNIFRDCLNDIAKPSPSTIGSLWVLKMASRFQYGRDLHELTSEHDLARLLIDELAAAVRATKSAGFSATISGPQNTPRKELLMSIIFQEPASITKDLGPKLWSLLVGPEAACQEDRDAAWQILTLAMKRSGCENPFTLTCFSEYLPTLHPKYFRHGTLDFVREAVMPLVNDPTSIVLDDDENPNHSGIEMLWRLALTAPTGTVEQRAIRTLVNDVYIESRSIQSFSHYRARKVHLALVDRCLRQLSSAAAKLRVFANGVAGHGDDSMEIVAADEQVKEQELLFIRSLAVLREFHQLHQSKPEFSAPDMRSLILESPKDIEGEPAELKYQSFDGDKQTSVMPLKIGKRNTAASLLASLREATGFNSYRIYYRGRPFVPQESDICKSLEDLQIHNGIILVKKEPEAPASPRVPQGASPVEIEILSHFDELWEYLSMEEKLAREIYGFLVKLPPDDKLLESIGDASVSYKDTFPLGQPFKSLYAVNALQEYLDIWRPGSPASDERGSHRPEVTSRSRSAPLLRSLSLVVRAITDPEIVSHCSNRELQIELSSALVSFLASLLRDPELPVSAAKFLDASLLDRLLAILLMAIPADSPKSATKHIALCLQSILESCCTSSDFMTAFSSHSDVPRIIGDLLLNDPRETVRQTTAMLIREKSGTAAEGERYSSKESAMIAKFRDFFWPLVSQLVRPAISKTNNSTEILELCFDMLRALEETQPGSANLDQLSRDWLDLLLNYTTSEDLTRPAEPDVVVAGLVRLLHTIICGRGEQASRIVLPRRGLARRIFWKHLFPPREEYEKEFGPGRPIACPQTRGWLMDIIFTMVKDDPTEFMWLLEDMDDLVPVFPNQDGDVYAYELPQQFERSKAIRAPCGYPGVRNLSNTCYFNSLLTQLFMNVDFREFMLGATVQDRQYSQNLLFQTQKLFAFLQDSVRPFINPEDCVGSIKTYEDTQIDVVIQMDVDEFYNLLFDRWEGQFLTSDEKNRFRSFYGGQLVQQVRSQECEHVSERLEPFSAIQCDIKGKSSLQESLQAYVDGEIMEGDNKYKCSTCDRHVDAVKRACLKDIPDNLIFHLKRFDFNLRTMQRSKINDYFSFPNKIDMRPYTIEHLSNPSQDQLEDIFELVGVLVHTGTAESGHYYSYIRERPTLGDTQTWVEFNDETVTPWDPASMASSCFGGPDYQSQFQSGNTVFEKQYSAYMLFYQRSSSLAKRQENLPRLGRPGPFRVKMPEDIEEYIHDENAWLLRRHCLFDPSQIQFVRLALFQLKSLYPNGCSPDHALETQAIAMALSHLDQVASRTKDVPDFYKLLNSIQVMCDSCAHCSVAVHDYFSRYTFAFRMLVQRNVDEEVRQATANFMIQVLQLIKERVPTQYGIPPPEEGGELDADEFDSRQTIIDGVLRIIEHLWQGFHMNLRSWNEVFDFMLSFVKLGRHELAAFLQHPHFLKWLIWIVWADTQAEPFLSPQFVKMVAVVSRRMPSRPPSYETIIALLDYILANTRLPTIEEHYLTTDVTEAAEDSADLNRPFEIGLDEANIIYRMGPRAVPVNIFVDRLITIAQNPASTNSIVANLMKQNRQMENAIYRTLHFRITGQLGHPVSPYLRVAGMVFCRNASDAAMINNLIKHVSQQCMSLQNAEGKAFLDFMRETFDSPRPRSGETLHQVILASLDRIPDWAPGLLGYFDTSVINGTEAFLQEKLFQYRTFRPHTGEEMGQAGELAEKMRVTARALGFRCLHYLHENYVLRNAEVTERAIAGLQRVIKNCSKYFNLKEPAEDDEAAEFVQLNQSIFDSLAGLLVVDELEEDGSGMYYSDDSSVASSNTAG